jgi:alkanesulfonate monooxygenase SsuD/methylene tetrahydromethanopterin reductase-like flavin-dependent oxidoreductase (luciferase family)
MSFQMLPEQSAPELLDAIAAADGLGYYACYSADEIYHRDAWLLLRPRLNARADQAWSVRGTNLHARADYVAQLAATLDELSDGRAEVVFGIGNIAMLEQYGVQWRGTRPIARLREAHEVMRTVLDERALQATPEEVADRIMVAGTPEDWVRWLTDTYAMACFNHALISFTDRFTLKSLGRDRRLWLARSGRAGPARRRAGAACDQVALNAQVSARRVRADAPFSSSTPLGVVLHACEVENDTRLIADDFPVMPRRDRDHVAGAEFELRAIVHDHLLTPGEDIAQVPGLAAIRTRQWLDML